MCVYACRHEEFQVCHSSLLNLGVFFVACADAAWWSHVREFRDACHVCEKFVEFLPWIWVSLSNLKESVFTHQIERERGRSQREAKWKSGSQRDLHALINSQSIDSKCFPRTEDNRTRHQREMEKKMERARERDIPQCVVQSSPVLSYRDSCVIFIPQGSWAPAQNVPFSTAFIFTLFALALSPHIICFVCLF